VMPKRCYRKHGAWYYVSPEGRWMRLGRSEEEALAAYPKAVAEAPMRAAFIYLSAFYSCQKNAKARGIPFQITREQFDAIVLRAGGRCELTRIRFSGQRQGAVRRRPYVPSLDRIDSAGAYTMENVRLICSSVNYALNEWGVEVFDRIAVARRRHLRRV
jgi:hypothetical protein